MELERYKEIVKEIFKEKFKFLKKINLKQLKEKLNFKEIPVFKSKNEETELEIDKLMKTSEVQSFIDNIIKKLDINETEEITLVLNTVCRCIMEYFQETCKELLKFEKYLDNKCPFCGNTFKYAYIDDDGKKFLVCSLCNLGWRFPRIKCPFCNTEQQSKLSYVEFENNNFVRFYECESCNNYHKVFILENMKNFGSIDEADLETKILDIAYEKS